MSAPVFRRGESDSFEWRVEVEIPRSLGKYYRPSFVAKFKRYDQVDVDRLADEIQSGSISARDVVDDVLIGWRDVKLIEYDEGQPPRFEVEEEREWMLNIAGMSKAIFQTWILASAKGAAKN